MSDDPFRDLRTKPQFPAVAVSRAGWTKMAAEPGDLTDASPRDNLADWQAMEIYDSAGCRFVARRVFRGWPKSALAASIYRLANNSIHVAFELDEGEGVSVQMLIQRLVAVGGMAERFDGAQTHREVIDRA